MLPPIDPSTLEQNPGFKGLYKDLSTRRLNQDGSSKDLKKQRTQDEMRKKLSTARAEAAKSQILRDSLIDLPSKAGDLPPELHEVIEIVCAQLHGQIPPEDHEFLEDDIEYFLENITSISNAISTLLESTTLHITLIANPEAPTKNLSALSANLPAAAAGLRDSTTALADTLTQERLTVANLAAEVLAAHRDLLEATIRILEQTMHGSVARATRAQAEHLAVKAAGAEMKLRIHAATHPPPPALVAALKSYNTHLLSLQAGLRAREQAAEKTLQQYERAGGKGMLEIAARYAQLTEEIERVNDEIARLEG
ncbi:hypothetical protein AOQ84DRAFT_408011 [Glonium stellatum]|uniref:Uncharacterized protein n=1 Tax=Glonium stellatum TaxID=574774 RepID=A0A8E2EZT5_9PEZI|nr:hypothetical protein AOQ84DRAFT_408011 [Glonium stellatum]